MGIKIIQALIVDVDMVHFDFWSICRRSYGCTRIITLYYVPWGILGIANVLEICIYGVIDGCGPSNGDRFLPCYSKSRRTTGSILSC